jgi:hypothetical protein
MNHNSAERCDGMNLKSQLDLAAALRQTNESAGMLVPNQEGEQGAGGEERLAGALGETSARVRNRVADEDHRFGRSQGLDRHFPERARAESRAADTHIEQKAAVRSPGRRGIHVVRTDVEPWLAGIAVLGKCHRLAPKAAVAHGAYADRT